MTTFVSRITREDTQRPRAGFLRTSWTRVSISARDIGFDLPDFSAGQGLSWTCFNSIVSPLCEKINLSPRESNPRDIAGSRIVRVFISALTVSITGTPLIRYLLIYTLGISVSRITDANSIPLTFNLQP
jgi:hypothetical protein